MENSCDSIRIHFNKRIFIYGDYKWKTFYCQDFLPIQIYVKLSIVLTNKDQTADVIICTTFLTCYLSICRSHVFVASTFEEMQKFRST